MELGKNFGLGGGGKSKIYVSPLLLVDGTKENVRKYVENMKKFEGHNEEICGKYVGIWKKYKENMKKYMKEYAENVKKT